LGAEGACVVVTGRDEEAGEIVVSHINGHGGNATFIPADLRNRRDIERLFAETADSYGTITTLVNNAAVQTETSISEATNAEWDLVVETNFRAYWLCVKHAVGHMDRGAVVNVSSNHAVSTMPGHFPYNAVKAGVEGMTRAMAVDLGPAIRVNSVTPGWVAVDRTTGRMAAAKRETLESIHPVGRLGTPADVAGAVAFLASDDAAFVTGTSLVVDGGRTAVLQDDTLPDYRTRRDD